MKAQPRPTPPSVPAASSESAFQEVAISSSALRTVVEHGRSSYPEEACGLLLGPEVAEPRTVRRVLEARQVPNRKTEERTHRFLIPADELRRCEQELEGTGRVVVGFYHSHPDHPARPSPFDQDHAWPWYAYLVLAVARGEAGDLGAFELEPEGRVFQPRRLKEESDARPPGATGDP